MISWTNHSPEMKLVPRVEAKGMTHAFQGCVGNGLCFFAALSKHLVEFRRVFHQLTMASLDGLQCCHGGLCKQWFELAPAHV